MALRDVADRGDDDPVTFDPSRARQNLDGERRAVFAHVHRLEPRPLRGGGVADVAGNERVGAGQPQSGNGERGKFRPRVAVGSQRGIVCVEDPQRALIAKQNDLGRDAEEQLVADVRDGRRR